MRCRSLFDTFILIRRHGDLDVEGISLPEAAPPAASKAIKRAAVVSDSTIDADLIYLNTALNWATDFRVEGKPLLDAKCKVPRCKPQSGTLKQPDAAEEDLEALRPVLDRMDPQRLLRYWLELMNQFGWRVTGLSSIKASEIDFTSASHAPHGRLLKNEAVDKERRDDSVPLTAAIATLLRVLLAFRGLAASDDTYLFPAPKSEGAKPWSRWHAGRLLDRADEAAGIAHIGGLPAWRRKWHAERKNYPAKDVAVAAGYADPRSVDRYRHADAETTNLVVTTPTGVIRRTPQADPGAKDLTDVDQPAAVLAPAIAASAATSAVPTEAANAVRAVSRAARPRRALRRTQRDEVVKPLQIAVAVGQGRGSAGRSVMPDGTRVTR
jgi:integrase